MPSNCLHAKTIVRMARDGSQTSMQHCGSAQCSQVGQLLSEATCTGCPQQLVLVTEAGPDVELTVNMVFRCRYCNLQISGPYKGQHQCRNGVPLMPDMTTRLTTYAAALARWVTAGRPTRSDEEVERIHTICTGCKWHDNGYCLGCGCRVSSSAFAILNKIRMATENCPKMLW